MKAILPGVALALGAMATSACTVTVDSQSQIVREEKRFAVSGRPDVRLTTFDGSIEIRSWDRQEVVIEVEKRGATKEAIDSLQIQSSQTGNVIELEVKRPHSEAFNGVGFHRTPTASLIVSLPRRSDVKARSGDGSIKLEAVAGRIELRTEDGSIRVSDASGELLFDTGDGSVSVDSAEGKLVAETDDGGVSVSGKLTSVRLRSGDGSIAFRALPGTTVVDDWEITTGDGSVSVYMPPDVAAELDASTGDGAISNDLQVTTSGEATRRALRGRLGSGGKLIRIRTGDGSIRLRPY